MQADIIIRNGRVVDPHNDLDGIMDVAIAGGKIVEVAPGLNPSSACEVIDAGGKLVVPGVVDSHVHLVRENSGGVPYNMLLRKGVTTAMDMAGGIETFLDEMAVHGHGLTAACLHALVVGRDLKTNDAGREEVAAAIDSALAKGAFGIKIMGGHYPFAPETTGSIIDECARRGAYVAFHAGTTHTGSNIEGFEEAVALADGKPLHVCHTNAYLRGQKQSPLQEAQRLLEGLKKNPRLVSESYISVLNGTTAKIAPSGAPASNVTKTCLERKGYSPDKNGMAKAIREGWAMCYAQVGGELALLPADEALPLWEERGTDVRCCFPVNDPVAMLACATARRDDGSFVVDAISTDGGGVPRNVIFENGVHLVAMRYMTMQDLVLKSSYYPARMLGLVNKGHLTPGADGDVAIFCPCTGRALYTIGSGKILMAAGVCVDTGPGTVVTSPQGQQAVQGHKLPNITPDLAQSTFLQGHK